MARRRSRIDGLKLPFVVTVAVTAGGCGGTVTGSQGSNDGTGAGAGTGGFGTGSMPSTGGAMPSTGGAPTTGGFTGVGGIWNPPLPETTCPDATPSPGTYCNYEGPPCSYGPLCGSFPTQSASCVGYTWSMSISSCNPPAPPVPPSDCDNPVAAGTPCSEETAHCRGPCSNSWQADNVCTNGMWTFAAVVTCGPNASNAPQCRNQFSGGALTPCCAAGSLDCSGKPDGYPGFGCTPGDGSYCSCTCYGGAVVCGC